jgi:UDP-N-acetylmuramoyl-L-alanyl-D-glutamate--2,6-diaminopimelate ligase
MEALSLPGKPLVVIDYAHTPDALLKALQAARAHCRGRLACVFGCGGERDRGKRALMAQVAERLADEVVVTDDNPRGEDGDAIVADILAGLSRPQRAVIERDRVQAIMAAIGGARAGDAILIAGKGHEDYQIVGAERRHFSDREIARAALGADA